MTAVLYPYKATSGDRDLRLSLRSLVNLPHSQVIVAGDKPDIPGVTHVPGPVVADRYMSSALNILAGLDAVRGESVIVMHDDMMVLRPWVWVHEHRGKLAAYIKAGTASGEYLALAKRTLDALQAEGVADPLFYSLHTPTVYEVAKLRAVIERHAGLMLRTVYWNSHPRPARLARDPKLRHWHRRMDHMPIVSTSDGFATSRRFKLWADRTFPTLSPYEVAA